MRLTTIWTLPGMAFAERLRRTRDSLLLRAAHRVPTRFAYWVMIAHGGKHLGTSAHPHEVVPEVPFLTVLARLDGDAA